MQQHKDLYLAPNIDVLNRIAQTNTKLNFLGRKPQALLTLAKKLYSKSQTDPFDEEMSYVFMFRFLLIYEHLLVVHNDKSFVSMILGKEASRVKAQKSDLKHNLINRYEELAHEELAHKASIAAPAPAARSSELGKEPSTTVFNNAFFITCPELFSAFSKRNVNLLIMDARDPNDFEESRIKYVKCINIPESSIQSGLSAHRLEQILPPSSMEYWKIRDSFDVIVLMDWNTSRTNYTTSKLEKLRVILTEWDIGRNYSEKPVILDCGYIEWLEMYPMLCTRPDIKYSKANTELDELLDLETIEYPTDSESKAHEVFNQELAREVSVVVDEVRSPKQLLNEEKLIVEKNKQVTSEILEHEKQWKKLHEQMTQEYDIAVLERLKREEQEAMEAISRLSQEETELLEKKSEIARNFNLSVSFEPREIEPEYIDNLKDIDRLQNEHLALLEAREALNKDRQRILDEARQAKKPTTAAEPHTPTPTVPEKPVVNRSNKPKSRSKADDQGVRAPDHVEGDLEPVRYGRTGLTNIRNTCYMNVTLQCLRHIPELLRFYCSGQYKRHIHRTPVITNEVAHIIRALWTNSYSVIKPSDFYNKFTSLATTYRQGFHEDCMEFFLQLFTYLSEDSAFEIPAKSFWTETQKAWHKQHGGKISFYINNFYHQIRFQQICQQCHTTNLKFEIENVFYLTVPDKDFSLEDCMESYLSSVEKFTCKRCRKQKQVRKTISCYPRILVIALKRHIQDFTEGKTRSSACFKKNEKQCHFLVDNFLVGNCAYELNAIALHTGTTQSGHYMAACFNPVNYQWYLYNDEEVRPIKNIHDPMIRTRAYAFFYSLKLEDSSLTSTRDGQSIYIPETEKPKEGSG